MKKIAFAVVALFISAGAFAGANVEAGKAAAAKFNCASCHGANFNEPIDPSYPKLAGQHKDYLVQALKSYQRGAVGTSGRSNAIMEAQAKALSNADIENIAAYLNSLQGSLILKK
ncbi:c-type cytochrome [Undibacterium sp. Ji22W]|uniref:c-type cytochrome n=1 Tax=Undibacterium sp. Ji22W TaxID=3413038 RepID=UPI003BEF6EEF